MSTCHNLTEIDKYRLAHGLKCWCHGIFNRFNLDKLEQSITRNSKFSWSLFSYLMIALIFLNLYFVHVPLLGFACSVGFFLVNSVFLGNTIFEERDPVLKFAFGAFLLVALIGIVGWTVLTVYNLDVVRSILVLLVVATISSIPNKVRKYRFSIEIVKED